MEPTRQPVAEIIADIERTEKELLELTAKNLGGGRPVFFQHFYLIGIVRRTLAQTRSFKQLIEDKNGLVMLAIIRLQLDTAFRLYALFWVTDPEDFAKRVFHGEPINRLKAHDRQLMTDKYLKAKLTPRYPWIDDVYSNTSGAIHFSSRHIMAALKKDGTGDDGAFEFIIGGNDANRDAEDYHELIAAFRHINMIINVAVEDAFSRLETNGTIAG